jgi:hypothetical protein
MLLDPFYVANEGKLLAIVASEDIDFALQALRSHSLGKDSLCRTARRCDESSSEHDLRNESTVCKISNRCGVDKLFLTRIGNQMPWRRLSIRRPAMILSTRKSA